MGEPVENLTNLPPVETEGGKRIPVFLTVVLIVLVLGLGIVTGYFVSGKIGKATVTSGGTGVVSKSAMVKGSEFGVQDASTFKDTAMGVIESGGIDGEGTHKLVREGGPSQTVYLNSSVLDLEQFVGKKIQVWGQTMQAQKAGWLMDVGKIKILE
ncbi:hypothetical protein COS54_00635 [Candidatus Shapirobacteria bacterium CG03_land_8_20_14_0_80_39_12]|uniref:Uncharacterized protein n=1 Tax=Candidatus Shapirobacteria bacterium CG03_land_8_20_14_0_80_39_12 TaxID=1974879 RepID=A0A2M7BEY7_9BACT|nr:MAG: hypothetical protein COS54_00635 [Candidatus Shapirobacteria bacterium CG03_land_8_20_14_0_80_39_12]